MPKKVEYRVREVTRFIVTRLSEDEGARSGDVSTKGEYDNANVAFEVAYALCKAEHDASDEPIGSMNFIYPAHPLHCSPIRVLTPPPGSAPTVAG